MAIKRSLGKLTLEISLGRLLELGRDKMGLEMLDVTAAHALLTEHLPFHHRDPFDRLLIAQARAEEMAIVGADVRFDAYGVRRLW
jgi:PIN domain nuclease of toxin-antitoxin system